MNSIHKQVLNNAKYFNSPYVKLFLVAIYVLIAVGACRYIKKNAYYDYDVVIYTACAIQDLSQSPKELHERTFGLIKKDLGQEKFERLTDSTNQFRNAIYKSPENFYSQLPFGKTKPLYVSILRVAYKCGFSPILFSTYINLFSYLLIAGVLLKYFIKHIEFLKAYIISLCSILLPIVLDPAKNNTPDLLSGAIFLITCLLLLSNKKIKNSLALILCCVLIFIRPENCIFIMSFCVTGYFFKSTVYSKPYLLALFISAILCYSFITFHFGTYSWTTLYKHSFVNLMPDLQNQHVTLSLKEYIKGFRFIPITVFYSEFFLIILFLLFSLINFYRIEKSSLWIMTAALIISIILRVVLFPDLSSRYYIGVFLVSIVLFFRSIEQEKSIIANV